MDPASRAPAGVATPSHKFPRHSRSGWAGIEYGVCCRASRDGEQSVRKIEVFLLFLLAAVVMAGLFGMLHDQISYSVSI
jgi:hypothetical protein